MTLGADRLRRWLAVLAGTCVLSGVAVAGAQAPEALEAQEVRMDRREFDAALSDLGQARDASYVAIRQRLVAQGERILPWLAEAERSPDVRRAVDGSIVRMWIAQHAYVRVCDGVLDWSIHVPSDYPHHEEGARVRTLVRVGPILLPRLYEALFRTGEYGHRAEFLATRVLHGLAFASPSAQEPLRAAMGDASIALARRTEVADILWSAYRDPRTLAFAEALARDEQVPPYERGWALTFMASRGERQVLTIVYSLLERPSVDVSIGLSCVSVIQALRDVTGAQRLLRMLLDRTWPENVRSSMPSPIGDVLGQTALDALRQVATTDPSERIRENASWAVSEMGGGAPYPHW
ncbi:MAG: hypothetical protein M5U28_17955 [Sandaracinaceae bacterium]|nr:hypothetical protein [Sandaracinaceae bacterium]